MEKKINEKLLQYLTEEYKTTSGKTCKSSYFAALKHARALTGRSTKDGEVINEGKTGDWAGTCMYLILIDHIGEKFSIKNMDGSEKNSFCKALKYFTNLNDNERAILNQLRNSFLHQFNLYNIPNKLETDTRFKERIFSVNRDVNNFIVEINNTEPIQTLVSLRRLASIVESIHKDIIRKLESDQIIINIPGGLTFENFIEYNTICY
jgi:hypothetical protein